MKRLFARIAGRGAVVIVLLGLTSGPAPAQSPDGHVDWPLGDDHQNQAGTLCNPIDGKRIAGCNLYVQQNFNNMDGPKIGSIITCGRAHAGTDFQIDAGTSEDANVYATADGVVLCVSSDYPGDVVVIQHDGLPGQNGPVYTMYAHLDDSVADGTTVRRGDVIGKVYDQSPNSHLHFEVRTFPAWDTGTRGPSYADPDASATDQIVCDGRGYAEEDGKGDPIADNGLPKDLDPGYLNGIDFILSHRPPLPSRLANLNVTVLQRPNDGAAEITGATELRPVAVVRDEDFQCETDGGADLGCFDNDGSCPDLGHDDHISNNRLTICQDKIRDHQEDCANGACDWWYEVEATIPGNAPPVTGYVKIFGKDFFHSSVSLGEIFQNENVGPWQAPSGTPLISLPLRQQDLAAGRFPNQGSDATLIGVPAGPLAFEPADIGGTPVNTLSFDGARSYLEIERSGGLRSREAFAFSLRVLRRENETEDVVVGQWDRFDTARQRWRVTFVPTSPDGVEHAGGELRFEVRWGPGANDVHRLRWVLPDCGYFGQWASISGLYDPTVGIRLFWNDRMVARLEDLGARTMIDAAVPLVLGSYADRTGFDLSRLDGAVHDFRHWAPAPVLGAPADSVLIIDSSGSMSTNDRFGQRRHAARIYFEVSPPDDHVGIVDFDSVVREANTSDTLLRLGDPGSIEALTALVNGIDSSGGTNIGAGLARSCQLLTGFQNGHDVKAGILLTDGQGPSSPADRACYQQASYSLWAIGFGDASLSQLVSITGSAERALVVSSAERALCELQQIRARLTGGDTVGCTQHTVYPGSNIQLTVVVPPGRSRMSFYTAWPGSDVVMTLTSPAGRVIGRTTTAPDVRHLVGPTFEVYTVETPQAGTWTVNLFGAIVRPGGEPVTFGASLLAPGDVRNLPPDVSAAVPSVATIWPPNNKMVGVQILGVTDPEEDPVTIEVTGITQDEPVSTPDPKHAPDGSGVGTAAASLRAERAGAGNGRIYHIHFVATDDKGASTEGSVQVCVPHDQGGAACIDDGQAYDSTVR